MARMEVENERPIDGLCQSAWGANECPNRAKFILKNRDNLGFAVMCEPHAAGLETDFPDVYAGVEELPYSEEKERELGAALTAVFEPYAAAAAKKSCKWCEVALPRRVQYYPHPHGYAVEGLPDRQWIYCECEKCHYGWSMRKLGIPEMSAVADTTDLESLEFWQLKVGDKFFILAPEGLRAMEKISDEAARAEQNGNIFIVFNQKILVRKKSDVENKR